MTRLKKNIKIGAIDMENRNEKITTYDEFVDNAKRNDPEKWNEIEFHADMISKIVIERNKLGISQEQLAKMTGLKQSAIARIESCNCVPKITTLQKILIHLGLTLEIKKVETEKRSKVLTIYEYRESETIEHTKWIKTQVSSSLFESLNSFKECV